MFPSDFVWGTAASAYQIEGGAFDDGRGECIWDRFARIPGAVRGGDDGSIACDFYHRYPEDVALMHSLGVDAFRFSVAWTRILPDGTGRVNATGLDFYDRLVDELLANGIEPWVNLYHFDLPQRLEDAGGWPARATAGAFADYAGIVASRLGDRVACWITHNEPFCPSFLGYGMGIHAPGRHDLRAAVAAAHHVLLSHGLAMEAIASAAPGATVGIVVDSWPAHPASESQADIAAARVVDGLRTRWFLDALLRGEYPADVLAALGDAAPPVLDGDLETISRPLDFLGVNAYSRTLVAAGPFPWGRQVRAPDGPLTASGWEIYPPAIGQVLRRIARDYDAPPLFVTENGAAFLDVRTHDGRIHDVDRIAFLAAYLDEVEAAMRDGVDVRGYFVWSLLDNFEWAEGYSQRFGLVYVDYRTLERVPKQSFDWFRRRIAASREPAAALVSARKEK
jgi:beta-glucosidase